MGQKWVSQDCTSNEMACDEKVLVDGYLRGIRAWTSLPAADDYRLARLDVARWRSVGQAVAIRRDSCGLLVLSV